jgi:hypothetical protein
MSIEELRAVVPPPGQPLEAGPAERWPAVQAALGIELPACRFETDYSTGQERLRGALAQTTTLLWSNQFPLVAEDPAFALVIDLIQILSAVIDEYEDRGTNKPCLFLSYAAKYALCRAVGVTHGVPSNPDIGGYAYQYTWYQYVPSLIDPASHPGGVLEPELDSYERTCAECVEDLAYQVSVAQLILSGACQRSVGCDPFSLSWN